MIFFPYYVMILIEYPRLLEGFIRFFFNFLWMSSVVYWFRRISRKDPSVKYRFISWDRLSSVSIIREKEPGSLVAPSILNFPIFLFFFLEAVAVYRSRSLLSIDYRPIRVA